MLIIFGISCMNADDTELTIFAAWAADSSRAMTLISWDFSDEARDRRAASCAAVSWNSGWAATTLFIIGGVRMISLYVSTSMMSDVIWSDFMTGSAPSACFAVLMIILLPAS